jgi:hypothetical protein
VADVEAEHKEAADIAKARKRDFESAVDGLRQLIHRRQRGLQDIKKGVQELPFGPDEPEVAPDEAWKTTHVVILEEFGTTAGITAALVEAGVKTLGDMTTWCAAEPAGKGKELKDIPKIGAVAVEKIDAALIKFWEARNASTPTDEDRDE